MNPRDWPLRGSPPGGRMRGVRVQMLLLCLSFFSRTLTSLRLFGLCSLHLNQAATHFCSTGILLSAFLHTQLYIQTVQRRKYQAEVI